MKNREILKFLAEKQSFPQLYKKYKTLDKSAVKKLLMDAAENFARSGAHRAATAPRNLPPAIQGLRGLCPGDFSNPAGKDFRPRGISLKEIPAVKVSGIIECFVDGAAQPNPGQAGAGAVFYRDSTKIAEISEYLGEKTNNQAEYSALIIALDKALKIKEKFSSLLIYSDSLLMVNQTNGLWRVKDAGIAVLIAEVKKKIENIKSKKNAIVSLKHIAREQNKTADALSVLAIKSKN